MEKKLAIIFIAAAFFIGGIFAYHQLSAPVRKSYEIASNTKDRNFLVNAKNEYSFSIKDNKGNMIKDFAITHTKPMHVIVVRKDLAYFQHVHPEFNAETGIFTLSDLVFPADGDYRIFANFVVENSPQDTVVAFEDVEAGDFAKYLPQLVVSDAKTKIFDGMDVTFYTHGIPKSGVENMLMFSLYENGKPVIDLEPYLGALGHVVILKENTLDFIHVHPMEGADAKQSGMVNFMVTFPKPGNYKVFTQFQRSGKVITTDFVVAVTRGDGNTQMLNMNGNH